MSRRKSPTKEEVEKAKKSIREKVERWQKMLDGDSDALMECMYQKGMCSQEDLNDYYKIKGKYGD